MFVRGHRLVSHHRSPLHSIICDMALSMHHTEEQSKLTMINAQVNNAVDIIDCMRWEVVAPIRCHDDASVRGSAVAAAGGLSNDFPPNRGVDFYFEFLPPNRNRGVDFYFEFLPAKSRSRFLF